MMAVRLIIGGNMNVRVALTAAALFVGITACSSKTTVFVSSPTSAAHGTSTSSSPQSPGSVVTSTPATDPTETTVDPTPALTDATAVAAGPSTVAPKPAPKPVSYSGRGNTILKIKKPEAGLVIASITAHGSSNFVVTSLLDGNQDGDLLVNEIGNYKGTVLLDKDGGETHKLKIEADGTWIVTLKPLVDARVVSTSLTGSGPDVLIYRGGSATVIFTSRGSDNVVLSWIGGDGEDLLVNEIGNYSGESAIGAGPGVLYVESADTWSLKVVPD
jgi:hypothetical protein